MKKNWSHYHNSSILGISILNLKSKEKKILICYTNTGELLFLDFFGNLIQHKSITDKKAIHCVKVLDINNDGYQEIVIGGVDGILRVFTVKDDLSLEQLWTHTFDLSISGIILEDINSDGHLDIIAFSLDRTLRIFNIGGELLWAQMFEKGIGDAIIWIDDKTKKKQIFAVGNDGTLRGYDGKSGELLWFKIFNNKLRCVSIINTNEKPILVCGGDDKILYFIEFDNHEILKTQTFSDYVWKCKSYPKFSLENLLISSYSFNFFNNSKSLTEIRFSSKLLCLNKNLEVKWELEETNIEYFCFFQRKNLMLIGIGTTKGDLILINEKDGKIIMNTNEKSCINMVQYIPNEDILIGCSDNGQIFAYSL
ncbi:MAG: WD40 repeat domain-containing protein [Candidatus Lokiarchaeota archaeon]|nr:WD40 repeat domain-containing protein [Candidatus Lokiarchaeota archaeon]